jgi:formate/nitrite transporter FocA (FNT family)
MQVHLKRPRPVPDLERAKLKPSDPAHVALARDRPLEEAQKSYHTVLEQQILEALEDLRRPAPGLALSALSAGLDLGFGPLLMAVLVTLIGRTWSPAATRLLMANGYAAGFVFVVIGRSVLFTERTTSAVLPVLARRASARQLLRLWGIVLAGNLVGAFAISAAIARVGIDLGIVDRPALALLADGLLSKPWWLMLLSAVLAGWLMGLLTWLVTASRDTVGQIVVVWMTTFVIGIAGLHHSIAGSIEVLTAIFARAGPAFSAYGTFVVWSVIGNAIGGSCFVAVLKFGHVTASAVEK